MTSDRHPRVASRRDIAAGLAVLAFGAFVVWEGSGYAFGQISRIGPGFFPVMLGAVLIGLGLGILVFERLSPGAGELGWADARAVLAIVASIGLFALFIERFGLAPAVFAAAFLSEAATPGFRVLRRLMVSAIISAVSVLVFVYALALPIPVFQW